MHQSLLQVGMAVGLSFGQRNVSESELPALYPGLEYKTLNPLLFVPIQQLEEESAKDLNEGRDKRWQEPGSLQQHLEETH